MADSFDAYHQWLGIPPSEQPPTHYSLLGLREGEADPNVIVNAADRQMRHVRAQQLGPHSQESQRLLNELANARRQLLKPKAQTNDEAPLAQDSDASPNPLPHSLPTSLPNPLPSPLPTPLPNSLPTPTVQSNVDPAPRSPVVVSVAKSRPYGAKPKQNAQPAVIVSFIATILVGLAIGGVVMRRQSAATARAGPSAPVRHIDLTAKPVLAPPTPSEVPFEEPKAAESVPERENVVRVGAGVAPVGEQETVPNTSGTANGWVQLFNGQDLSGWVTRDGGSGNWRVANGAITCFGSPSYLYTRRDDFSDFHLRAEVKINGLGNSGIHFRVGKPLPNYVFDYEAQITCNPGQLYKTGSLYGLAMHTKLPSPDTWFTYEIIAQGNRTRLLVDGQETANYSETRPNSPTRGNIALQHHDSTTEVYFRKIEITELETIQGAEGQVTSQPPSKTISPAEARPAADSIGTPEPQDAVAREQQAKELLERIESARKALLSDADLDLQGKTAAVLESIAASESDTARKLALLVIAFGQAVDRSDASGNLTTRQQINEAWRKITAASRSSQLTDQALRLLRVSLLATIDWTTVSSGDRVTMGEELVAGDYPALLRVGDFQTAAGVIKMAEQTIKLRGKDFAEQRTRIKQLRDEIELAKKTGSAMFRLSQSVETDAAPPERRGLLLLTQGESEAAAEQFRQASDATIRDAQKATDTASDADRWLAAGKSWEAITDSEPEEALKEYWKEIAVRCFQRAKAFKPGGTLSVKIDEGLARLGAAEMPANSPTVGANSRGTPPVKLTQLRPLSTSVGFGQLGVNTAPPAAWPYVSRDARAVGEFIFAHAPSNVAYALPTGFRSFQATGYNDSSRAAGFEVYADQTLLETFLQNGQSAVPIGVDIPPGTKVLRLATTDLGDNRGDQTFWVEPRVFRRPLQEVEADSGIKAVSLTTIRPVEQKVGHSELLVNRPWTENYFPVLPATRATEFLYAHADSRLVFAIPAGARAFTAIGSCNLSRTVQYQVFADGILLFMSPFTQSCVPMHVPLPPSSKQLTLVIDNLGDGANDASSWVYPEFQMAADEAKPSYETPESPPHDVWISLLKRVDLGRHTVRGNWGTLPQGLGVEPMNVARLILPVYVDQETPYDISVEVAFKRLEGNDAVSLLLPIGSRANLLVNGWPRGGFKSYLSMLDGKDANVNPLAIRGDMLPVGPHVFETRFGQSAGEAFVKFAVDKRTIVDWRGAQNRLSQDGYWATPDGTIGLGAFNTKLLYTGVRMQVHEGDVQWLPNWPDLLFEPLLRK